MLVSVLLSALYLKLFDGVQTLVARRLTFIIKGGFIMYFDFVFDIFSSLTSLPILVPVVALSALYGIIFLCISLYRSVEK